MGFKYTAKIEIIGKPNQFSNIFHSELRIVLHEIFGHVQAEFAHISAGSDIASGRIAEMHRRICHALHDVHLAARMPRAFLNLLSEYDERILLTFNATEHKIKAS